MPTGDRLLVLATTAAGVVLALAVTLAQPSLYRADASIVLSREGQPPGDDPELAAAAAAAAGLFNSRAVAESASRNLGLEESPDELLNRIDVETEPQSSLVRVEVEAPGREEARRTAQEVVEVATVLFNSRFGPVTTASIWDAPRGQDERVSPNGVANAGLGGLLGAALGVAGIAYRRRGGPVSAPPPAASADARVGITQASLDRLEERIAAVTAREIALAQRAAVLSLREREVAEETERLRVESTQALPSPEPEPEPGAAPPAVPFVAPGRGDWTVQAVERLLAEHGGGSPEELEELGFYLESFREVAGPDGRLPHGVQGVVEDVFRESIERARR